MAFVEFFTPIELMLLKKNIGKISGRYRFSKRSVENFTKLVSANVENEKISVLKITVYIRTDRLPES